MATTTKRTTTTGTRKTINETRVSPESRKEEIKKKVTKKEVFIIRNVICKYGVFNSGEKYSVDEETEKKLRGLGAIKC